MENPQAKIVQEANNKWLVSGPVLVDNANALLLESDAFALTGQTNEIDFSKVTEVDTAAISLMMEWLRRAEKVGSKVRFTNLPASLTSLAALYGVTAFIPLSQ